MDLFERLDAIAEAILVLLIIGPFWLLYQCFHASNERRDEGVPSAHLPDRTVEEAR